MRSQNDQTVYVVDDDPAVRDSLCWLIESAGLNVRTFENAGAFLACCRPSMSGCLVVDVRMPGMSGLDMCDRMRDAGVGLATIVISGHGDVPQAVRAMKGGAIDFIEKPFSDRALMEQIDQALAIDRQNRDLERHAAAIAERYASLSIRERQVMRMVVEGLPNKAAAARLNLSSKTVEVHRGRVMKKMKAPSLPSLVRMAATLEASGMLEAVPVG